MEAAGHYLQPVIETYWAFLCVHAINVEVGEVKRDCEAALNRNDVLTGYRLSEGIRVSWTEQMSLWLIKYTTIARHCANQKSKKSSWFNGPMLQYSR